MSIVLAPAGHLRVVLAFTVNEARKITAIHVIANPDRLERLNLSVLPEGPGPAAG